MPLWSLLFAQQVFITEILEEQDIILLNLDLNKYCLRNILSEARERAPWLRALVGPAEDPGSVLSPHMMVHSHPDSSSGIGQLLLNSLGSVHTMYMHLHAGKHPYT